MDVIFNWLVVILKYHVSGQMLVSRTEGEFVQRNQEINQKDEMAADRILGKVKLEFNSLISNSDPGFHSGCT